VTGPALLHVLIYVEQFYLVCSVYSLSTIIAQQASAERFRQLLLFC